jgi:nicotinate-nucleotide pyrophosphorylase (carboxylating)
LTHTHPPSLEDFVSASNLTDLIRRAREEDLGPDRVDVTSTLFVPEGQPGEARIVARQPGRLAGAALLSSVMDAYGADVTAEVHIQDGQAIEPGQAVATLAGPLRDILTAERVALNLMTHLSGVASLTARYVDQVTGTRAKVYDTRKTLPGLRGLQKYAVACGGGATHRMGLYDAVLLKDNHLAHVDTHDLAKSVTDAVKRCQSSYPALKFVMIEVDTLAQLEKVLPSGVDLILLDNMTNNQLTEAVGLRDRLTPKVELEASGGVTLETIRAIAQTGVDRISVGALTHSAPALDLGLDIR